MVPGMCWVHVFVGGMCVLCAFGCVCACVRVCVNTFVLLYVSWNVWNCCQQGLRLLLLSLLLWQLGPRGGVVAGSRGGWSGESAVC